jgi:hypothetical protein
VVNCSISASKPLKERTSKAERRAKQEAERAAKAAAKESGICHHSIASTSCHTLQVLQTLTSDENVHEIATLCMQTLNFGFSMCDTKGNTIRLNP